MIFQLGTELYGTPLLSVREVIENRQPKPVPNAAEGFEGVINLRGDVVGVIDLRKMLKLTPKQSLSILVFESEMGTLGGVVDKCIAVLDIPESSIERKGYQMRDGSDYCLGIGKLSEGLVTLIDLVQVAKRLGGVSIAGLASPGLSDPS